MITGRKGISTASRLPNSPGPNPQYRLLRWLFGTPARLMLVAWSLCLLVFWFGPAQPKERVSVGTWSVIAACIVVFELGCRSATMKNGPPDSKGHATDSEGPAYNYAIAIRRFAWLGLFGGLCLIVDKLFFSGVDYSAGFSAARLQAAQRGAAGDLDYARTPLLYLGQASYSFATVAFTLAILHAHAVRRRLVYGAALSLLAPTAVTGIYGGRAGLLLPLLLAFAAVVLRVLRGRGLRTLAFLAPVFLVLVIGSSLYNRYVLSQRWSLKGAGNYGTQVRLLQDSRDFYIKPWARGAMESGTLAPQTVVNLFDLSTYVAGGPVHFERVMQNSSRIGPYLGQYQARSIATLLLRNIPQLSYYEAIGDELAAERLNGVFLTAWGAGFVDFGWVGLVVSVYLWGLASGRVWRRAVNSDDTGSALLACFLFAAIVVSPLHSLVGFGTGLFLLIDIIIARKLLISWNRVPVESSV